MKKTNVDNAVTMYCHPFTDYHKHQSLRLVWLETGSTIFNDTERRADSLRAELPVPVNQ